MMAGAAKVIARNGFVPAKRFVSVVNRDHGSPVAIWLTFSPKSHTARNFSQEKQERSILFRHLQPQNDPTSSQLLRPKQPFHYFYGIPRPFFSRRKRNKSPKKNKKRVPKLILVQNPVTWLMTKIDFGVLRIIWDPSFSQKDFRLGTKQAISRVTQVISVGQYNDLRELLTNAAWLSLMRELDRNWGDRQRSLLALTRDDIQISAPRKVHFIRLADKKYCDVDMAFLALKWAPIKSIDALIFTEIFARFHREYTPHCPPDWTIAYFKVTRFEVLRHKQNQQ